LRQVNVQMLRRISLLYPRRVHAQATGVGLLTQSVQVKCNSSTSATASSSTKNKSFHGTNSVGSRKLGLPAAFAFAAMSLCAGYTAGKSQQQNQIQNSHQHRELPSGEPRSCCSCESSQDQASSSNSLSNLNKEQKLLPAKLKKIVGESNVLLGHQEDSSNTIYLKGARLGRGNALAIVTPTTLREAVKILQEAVAANCVVVPQGANTGLTGGSVPRDQQRPAVVISMRKLDTMFPIDNGAKVVCLAGAGIATLANSLPEWGFSNRESHSTLGSTFLNPTTAAGIAFGSGGTQLRKGPAYSDRALYAKVYQNKWGKNVVEVVNTLGIEGIEDSNFVNNSGTAIEQLDVYARDVQTGYQRPMAKSSDSVHGKAMASDRAYTENVCKTSQSSVNRFNADTKGEDCNRSEGKVLILATVHDTFPKAKDKRSFWISCENIETALAFRKEVCLDNPKDLPISVEYMDRDSFDVIDRSGRVMGNLIKIVGMGSIIGMMWQVKLKIEALPFDGAELVCDKFLHIMNNLTPSLLPSRMMESGKKFDHHIAMTVGDFGDNEMDRCLERLHAFEDANKGKIFVHESKSDSEENSITAFRFVAAPAFRTYCVGENYQGISVDYALPKNGGDIPTLGNVNDEKGQPIPVKRMRYSHFGCNVVHEDLAYELGVDTHAAKYALKKQVENTCGGKLPAEHGHGTEYAAPKDTQKRWKRMDPLNVLNPGIGGLSSNYKYGEN